MKDKLTAQYEFSFFNRNLAFTFLILITISVLYSCQKEQQKITLNGFAKGLNGYVIGIQLNDSTIASENVINDQFTISTMLPRKDFYTLKIWPSNGSGSSQAFSVYLSEGECSVRMDSTSVEKYPEIVSNSSIQNDLTKYYLIKEENTAAFQRKYALAKKDYDDNFLHSEGAAFDKLTADFAESESNLRKSIDYSKKEFITHNRESTVSAYFLSNSFPDMEYQPGPYLKLFNALSGDVKKSKYGSTVKNLLSKYNKAAVNTSCQTSQDPVSTVSDLIKTL